LPAKSFDDDSLFIVPGSRFNLDAGPDLAVYTWNDGSAQRYLEVDKPGYYSVRVEDANCCYESDTIKIVLLDLLLPNAFTPDNDLLNDTFGVKGNSQGVNNFSLSVYNLWGQLVWRTTDLNLRWDGKFQGELCPAGVYSYVLRYTNAGSSAKKKTIVKEGMLSLMR
jgi:gliding motility-associated-like protein